MKNKVQLALVIVIFVMASCQEENQTLKPNIASISPTSGIIGSTVIITGENFDKTPSNNMVKFNGTTAVVTVATATSLTTTVPTGATTGTITVTVNRQTATSSSVFTILQPPTITNFSPTSAQMGSTVTINGTNFDPTPANNTVKFNGTVSVVTQATATSLKVTVPTGATTGTITVNVNGQTATSSSVFTYLPPCQCGAANTNLFTGSSITTQKATFDAAVYSYQFCANSSGDLTSGFAMVGTSITNCSSLLKTVGFNFTLSSDPLATYLDNSLGADLFVIVVDNQKNVRELIHPSNATWTSSVISNSLTSTASIASYWSNSKQYLYVYFVGTDGGLYAIFKDLSTGKWTTPNNLLPIVGLANNAAEIASAKISVGTAGDDLFISFKTSKNTVVNLSHLSTSTWKVI